MSKCFVAQVFAVFLVDFWNGRHLKLEWRMLEIRKEK